MWIYVIRTGNLWYYTMNPGAFTHIAVGYSGHGKGLNNPYWIDQVGIGPLPEGEYTIGPPHTPIDHLGPFAMPLIPKPDHEMFGRSGFFMHGDNQAMNHSASNGCLIFDRDAREKVNAGNPRTLHCIAEEKQKGELPW